MLFRKIAAELFESTNCKRVDEGIDGGVDFAVAAVLLLIVGDSPFCGLELRGVILFLAWSASFFLNWNPCGVDLGFLGGFS